MVRFLTRGYVGRVSEGLRCPVLSRNYRAEGRVHFTHDATEQFIASIITTSDSTPDPATYLSF